MVQTAKEEWTRETLEPIQDAIETITNQRGQLSNRLNPTNPYNKMSESQCKAVQKNKKITDWLNDRKPLRNGKHVKDFEYVMYDKAANVKMVLEFANKMAE